MAEERQMSSHLCSSDSMFTCSNVRSSEDLDWQGRGDEDESRKRQKRFLRLRQRRILKKEA